jgi:nucleotide-binding universal stress UspA family protein
MIKRILLGLGGTPYTSVAIRRAVGLAKRFEAEVTGVTVTDVKGLSNVGLVPAGALHGAKKMAMRQVRVTRRKIEESISEFESVCAADGIKFHIKQEERTAPFDLMISLARYHDLMIFGLRSIFEYNFGIEERKDTLARLIAAGVRPIIAVSDTLLMIVLCGIRL